jgi:hypothetical protein
MKGSVMTVKDDPAWAEWKAALDRVNSAAQTLRGLRGAPETAMENMKARVAFEAALEALARAAKKIAPGDSPPQQQVQAKDDDKKD